MTFLGTTISIVLTFGTAAWIEKKEAEESRRLLAMTIVSEVMAYLLSERTSEAITT